MYKFLFTLLCICSLSSMQAQDKPEAVKPVTINPNAPHIAFKEEAYDFGTVVEGPKVNHDFKFSNTGKEALVLSSVKASCGCTTPTWPKEPVLPGKQSTITVQYNTEGRIGAFTKTITIESNATEPTKVVTIRGTVIKPEDDHSIPVARPSVIRSNN